MIQAQSFTCSGCGQSQDHTRYIEAHQTLHPDIHVFVLPEEHVKCCGMRHTVVYTKTDQIEKTEIWTLGIVTSVNMKAEPWSLDPED